MQHLDFFGLLALVVYSGLARAIMQTMGLPLRESGGKGYLQVHLSGVIWALPLMFFLTDPLYFSALPAFAFLLDVAIVAFLFRRDDARDSRSHVLWKVLPGEILSVLLFVWMAILSLRVWIATTIVSLAFSSLVCIFLALLHFNFVVHALSLRRTIASTATSPSTSR